MGHIEVAHLSHLLPDGRVLLGDASFRIGEGTAAALAGPNGAGKTTLIRIIAGDLAPQSGTVSISGGLGVMRQFIGGIRRVAPPGGQDAGGARGAAVAGEQDVMEGDGGAADGQPELPPRDQNVRMRLRGGRTGKRAVICENLELTGLMSAFSTEIWYGERVAVLGSNGSGKSFFLRLLAGEDVPHQGTARLGARVVPGLFAQTHARPDLAGRWPEEILMTEHALLRNEAMAALARYELQFCARQPFGSLSGGQQARLQILLLELAGCTLLLLDEPTDNLDLASAEALQAGLEFYQGTVLSVTHDRWFARSFDRFLVFGADGNVYESSGPVWDETRVARPR
jgi:ATPase subunit of ABC transporter with duplicated ATPase domains